MIKFFRSYNPFNIIWLVILLFILRIVFLLHPHNQLQFNFVESFARELIPVSYENALTPTLNIALAGVLVFAQALILNYLVNFYNLLGRPSFLPATMYITVTSLFTPFLTLSPPLICNFLLLWMLHKLFSLYKSNDVKSTAYDLGMLVALGTLIYLPYIYLMLAIWIALIIFRPFNWRDWAASIIGYATIFLFLAVFYYLRGHLADFNTIWIPLGTKFPDSININYHPYLELIPVTVIFILCFFRLRENYYKSYVQVRKSYQLLFIIFMITALAFYVKAIFVLNHFLLCAIPAAIFFSYYFLYSTRRWFYETLYLIVIISIIFFQFNTF